MRESTSTTDADARRDARRDTRRDARHDARPESGSGEDNASVFGVGECLGRGGLRAGTWHELVGGVGCCGAGEGPRRIAGRLEFSDVGGGVTQLQVDLSFRTSGAESCDTQFFLRVQPFLVKQVSVKL